MKASDLIEKLQSLIEEHGDLPIFVKQTGDDGDVFPYNSQYETTHFVLGDKPDGFLVMGKNDERTRQYD